ncbi:MAG TPA: hypothetical protein VJ981_00580 [Gammaproteobacteria bacterium]|nr:hypothetical protein [Gammaproteobacteria bacterium]
MNKRILPIVSALIFSLASLSAYAYFSWDYMVLENTSLKGINTITVAVDPPVRSLNDELVNHGVSATELQKRMIERLQAAGLNVVSREQASTDPQAALLKLRIHMTIGYGAVYSWGLNLSLNQKVALNRPESFYPVRTWSTGKFGGTQQTNLRIINDYSMQLVNDFIDAYHAQN